MQFIDLKSQYEHLKSKIDNRIATVLDHGQYIMGPEVSELEQQLANYVGVKHVVSCANGTDALELSLIALGIGPGDAVIVPSFTFFASAESICKVGAKPVFCDIDLDTFNLCTDSLKNVIESHKNDEVNVLKAVMTVDLFGLPANYSAIQDICKNNKLLLIEDAAQGFGGSHLGNKACSFGHIATTSFFPAKPLGCYGDGGAIFTDDDEVADTLRSLRVHGKGANKYDNVRIGVNSRLDTLQAAILLEKLANFDNELELRNNLANFYHKNILDTVRKPGVEDGYTSSWAQYTLRFNDESSRDSVRSQLSAVGVPSVVYYPTPMHKLSVFEHLQPSYSLANSELASKTVLSIPMSPFLSDHDRKKVVSELNRILENN